MTAAVEPFAHSDPRPSRGPGSPNVSEAVLGEVITGLLDSSEALPATAAQEVLELVPGQRAQWTQYPVLRTTSPFRASGVDCSLATAPGGRVRGIGTVAARAVLTGGHVVQGSVQARALIGASMGRQRWAYYHSRPGVVEIVNRTRPSDLVEGFLLAETGPELLDLGGVGFHVLDQVNSRPELDHGVRLKSRRHRLRWAAEVIDDLPLPTVAVRVVDDGMFLVRMTSRPEHLPAVVEYCEDLALHIWLLSTLRGAFERSARAAYPIDELAPALDYLAHLWNPGVYLQPEVRHLWTLLEEGPQLSREWATLVGRVRDRISLLTLRAMEATLRLDNNW